MYPKRSGQADRPVTRPLRSSDRLRRRPKVYGRPYLYYSPTIIRNKKSRTKTRTAASRIAKMLRSGDRSVRTSNGSSGTANLRRSSRKRRVSVNLVGYTESSGSGDEDMMRPYRPRRNRVANSVSQDESPSPKQKKTSETKEAPRREGLCPRRSKTVKQINLGYDDEQSTSDEKVGEDETENGNDLDDEAADDDQNDAEDEGDEEAEEGEEEQEGRRRYDLRNRADVRRLSMDESKQRSRSPRRDVRKGGSRVHKRHRLTRAEDSDDSILVDELDQGPAIPWGRGGSRSGPPWLFGGLDMHGTTAWGLNVAASGWGNQSDPFATLTSGIQTAGPSSKGGADIQPLQVDESVSFDEIGGLSEYVDALKEMVFFPLLYPDFFASYHITPPRGVLLCGPPGTGKTLIARALASAASKAGQKVSFYMRKGADVLSKWVGEAERQLKLLFEEAQRNQPSIIFFDEIDGLAPVRSSKQEQIHNSIVSTLLALMDGLDSRGQVVLIGATNRIDAIDGALRRPGRFDREFNFPLPGCEARAEILDIHTRKWKQPPSKELKMELAASCVGYCGADLKALCTEAAIRAFREKYPQVYTSDDKYLIDVDSVKVEKYHFIEAMSTITPASQRGSIVHSRPLSLVVAPCLQRHLQKAVNHISDIFPPLTVSSELTKLSILSYGSAIPLVYRPRLLLCGGDGSGLDHLGPAILHELEKFPVHSLGLPSLLSDPSAKTSEEAVVHIFSEARRTTPSILYIPQFNLWWDNAYEQLRAVLLTLLEELPSDLPILLLGTSSTSLAELDGNPYSVFPQRTALSVLLEAMTKKSKEPKSLPELPKVPKVASGPKVSELKAKVEAEHHAIRRLRMCLRDVCNRILYDKRFSAFHYPVTDEDAPNYRSIIQNPMDVATLLQRVDSGQYLTCSAFVQDVDLIVTNAKVDHVTCHSLRPTMANACQKATVTNRICSLGFTPILATEHCMEGETYRDDNFIPISNYVTNIGILEKGNIGNACRDRECINLMGNEWLAARKEIPHVYNGDDYNGARIVSRACELRDAVHGMLSQMDPALVAYCDKIAAQGGPAHMPDDLGLPPAVPVMQLGTSTRASARLRNVQPEADLQSYKALKRPKKNADTAPAAEDKSQASDSVQMKPSQTLEVKEINCERDEPTLGDGKQQETSTEANGSQDTIMLDGEISTQAKSVKKLLVERTGNYGIPELERLYSRIMKGIFESRVGDDDDPKPSVLEFLLKFAEDDANFSSL
ncbi:hypothetical protein GOBAR_AA16548 [Gossypium barbadense]|uniref:Bromo domain-containing protein n=1 Tax=Gossypium barbadense TaxID=3634 RepID=A0A2P5XLD4_GOSBA|nr:hypothetical protein GOBAR_AA16548 [Gossypium barbadense]